jgi:hypothetical protein
MFTSLVEEANLGYTGPAGCRPSATACLALCKAQNLYKENNKINKYMYFS